MRSASRISHGLVLFFWFSSASTIVNLLVYFTVDQWIDYGVWQRAFVLSLAQLINFLIFATCLVLDRDHTRRADVELRRAREDLEIALEAGNMGSWEIDLRTQLIDLSSKTREIYGFDDRPQILAADWQGRIHLEDKEKVFLQFMRAVEGGLNSWDAEYRIVHPSKGVVWVNETGKVFFNKEGAAVRGRGICRDVTQRKLKEEQMKDSEHKVRVSAQLAALGEMAAGISHEINNPMQAIKVRTSVMLRSFEHGIVHPQSHKMVEQISVEVDRVANIISAMKILSRDPDSMPNNIEFSACKIIEQSLSLCRSRMSNRAVKIIVNAPEGACMVMGNPISLSQALVNLLNNAMDAVCSLPEDAERRIKIDLVRFSGVCRLSVTDTGPGVSPAAANKLFQPFFTTKPVGQGTGLGLSIAKSLIEKSQGKLYLDSQNSETCFVIELPSAHAEKAA